MTVSSGSGVTMLPGGSGGGAASGITVGTSVITGGTNTRILYNNNGALGEYTLTGSGTVVVMQNTPTLTTPVIGAATGTSVTLTGLVQAGTTLGISTDVLANRDAANTWGFRNGTADQVIYLYETFTDASNYSRLGFGRNLAGSGSTRFSIFTQSAGTGSVRGLHLSAEGATAGSTQGGTLELQTDGTVQFAKNNIANTWSISGTSPYNLLASTDGGPSIGASGATRPKDIFLSGYVHWGGQSRVATQFDKTSDTALANVTGLTSTLAASKTYSFIALLYTASNVASGIKVAIGGTATATTITYDTLITDTATITQPARATALGTAGGVTTVTAALIQITGTITVNAGGTLTVQAAQNVSGGTASSVLVGSTFYVDEF